MFIKSVSSGGGYRGDVNTSYRFGRRAALDDYIDAYNKALQADQNTYDFNQNNVRDTATNYKLSLGMDQDARTEATNFLKDSNSIGDAVQNFEIGQFKRDNVQPYVAQVGRDQAVNFVNTAANQAQKSTNELRQAKYTADLQPLEHKQKMGSTRNTITSNNLKARYDETYSPDYRNKVMPEFIQQQMMKLQKQPGNENKSAKELADMVVKSAGFNEGLDQYINDQRGVIQQRLSQQAQTTKGSSSKTKSVKLPKFEPLVAKTFKTDGLEYRKDGVYYNPTTNAFYYVEKHNGKVVKASTWTPSTQEELDYANQKWAKVNNSGPKMGVNTGL